MLRRSRDGRRLVYQHSSERRLLLHDLDEFESRPLPGTEGASRPFLSPDGRWIGFFQSGKIRKIAYDGGDPIDICEAPVDSPGATWGPGDVILFNPTWIAGLWRVPAAGGTPVELTKPDREKGETGHFWASFLPGGQAALFTIFGGQGLADSKVGLLDLESGRYEVLFEGAAPIYVASGHVVYYSGGVYRSVPFDAARRRVTGEETTILRQVRRLSPVGSAEAYAAFSETGVLAYVEGDSTLSEPPSRFVWVSREGLLDQELPFEGNHGVFRLSPDGTRIAATRFADGRRQIHVYDLERGTTEQLTRDGQSDDPAWNPDGRRVAFTSLLEGTCDLFWAPTDGAVPAEPLIATPADESAWQWTPDGQSGLYTLWSPVSGQDLWRASASGDEPSPLLASDLSESGAALSPDGKWLAYNLDDSLYVAPYPSLGQRTLIARSAGGPRWSPSGSELFYIEQRQLKAVGFEVHEGAFRAGAATTLFRLERLMDGFEVAPDGERFLFRKLTDEGFGRDVIRVVLNGFDLLRAEAGVEDGP